MVEFYCTKCNFRITLREGKKLPQRCTYCDSRGTLRRVKSAQDLIDETLTGAAPGNPPQ